MLLLCVAMTNESDSNAHAEARDDVKSVPVVTANFKPLRFVSRSAEDVWKPTLEEINSRTYDYVKLHRLSTYLDVGIAPLSLGICFDGTLVLPATTEFRILDKALAVFNKTLSELLMGGLYCEAVSPDDICYGSMTLTAYARIHGGGDGPAASFHKAARTKHIGAHDAIRLLQPDIVLTDDLQSALSAGRMLVNGLGEVPREQILFGVTYYVNRQWAESLIHVWTTTERIIEIAWQKYVANPSVTSKSRRQFLNDHRTWTSSAKLELLFQKGLLHIKTYEKLDQGRKARNEFAHRGTIPTQSNALVALEAAFELASLCVSDFKETTRFDSVISVARSRCPSDLFPKKTRFDNSEVTHWLSLPPLPGDVDWGEREFEIIPELCLKPLTRSR